MTNTTPGGQEGYLPVTSLKGVGPKVAERLARLDINSVEDLLFHLPYRYEDRTHITPIGAIRAGNEVVIQGKVELTEIKFARRRILLSRLSDGTGFITLRFFHFNARQQAALARGVWSSAGTGESGTLLSTITGRRRSGLLRREARSWQFVRRIAVG